MGEIIRSTDWRDSELGSRERWPESLRIAVNLAVESALPMALLWGRERLLLYNDACRVIAGDRYPLALGRSIREAWPEVWELLRPFLAALERGRTVHLQDQRLSVAHRRGDASFTLSCSAVRDQDGSLAGSLLTLFETKRSARTRQGSKAMRDPVAAAADRELLAQVLERIPVLVATYDPALQSFRFNEEFTRVLGWTDEDARSRDMMSVVYPDPGYREEIRRSMDSTESGWREFELAAKDGTRVVSAWANVRLSDGTQVGIGIDLRERKRSEEALREWEERLGQEIAMRKQVEQERLRHLFLLESMDRVNRAIAGTDDVGKMMSDVLDLVLSIFECDRAFLLCPCDPGAPTWSCSMERTRPQYPGILTLGREMPMNPEVARTFRILLASDGPVKFGPGALHALPKPVSESFAVRSFISMAVHPKVGKPWQFGIHQCSYARVWTREEERLLQEIARRLADGLTTLLAFREMRDSQVKLREAQRIAHLGCWDRDFVANRVELADEACRIFGLPARASSFRLDAWHEQWLRLIHPEDRAKTADAFGEASRGGPPYCVDYRLLTPRGEVRHVHSEAVITRDESGRPRRALGILQDVTERIQAESALRESEERFRTMVNAIPQLAWLARPDGFVYWFNQCCLECIGKSPREMEGWGRQTVHHPEALPEAIAAWRASIATGEPHDMEFPLRVADGTFRRFLTRVLPLRDSEGRVVHWLGTQTDVTELLEAQEALKRERDFSSAVVDTAGALVIVFDRAGTVRRVNRACEQATGYASAETLGRHLTTLVPVDELAKVRQVWEVLLERRQPSSIEYELLAKDGSRRRIAWSNTAITGPDGSVEYVIATGVDVTERNRAEAALRNANDRLIEADRRKNEFLAVLSHELRNPLAPIRNSIYILERAAPGGDQAKRAQQIIDRQVQHMTRLVEDLLDITRISRGKINLQRERVDLNALARGAAEDHREVYLRNGIDLQVKDAGEPLWVDADPTRLAQVIGNLLNNSAKFTARGGTTVLSVEPSARGEAVIRVRDDGAGIAPDTFARLFEPFAQAAQTLERSRGGLGLGLALVKGLVEMHGGTVVARSEGEDKGSEFTITLPLQSPTKPKLALVAAPKRRSLSRRVLVIEDNLDAAESLREALELADHEVAVAFSGPEGIETARRYRPDVILCDLGLPGVDGFGVAKALRADGDAALRSTFLVALSGYALVEDVARSKEAGFDRHLAKPPKIEDLEMLFAQALACAAAQ